MKVEKVKRSKRSKKSGKDLEEHARNIDSYSLITEYVYDPNPELAIHTVKEK